MTPTRTHSFRTLALLACIGGLMLTGSAAVVEVVLARLGEPVPTASFAAADVTQTRPPSSALSSSAAHPH